MTKTAEQQARDLLKRMGIENAQSFSAGELVELANLIHDSKAPKVQLRSSTYTYAVLEVSYLTYYEIKKKLENAQYQHTIQTDPRDGEVINMHGIALRAESAPGLINGIVNDWVTKCAQYLGSRNVGHRAAVIATFAEPLVALLRESKREHYHCDDSWHCCGKCTASDHSGGEDDFPPSHAGESARESGVCNCGADAWNARVDAALAGNR